MKPRARDLGVPFDGTPGPHNAITDVAGVEVGHTTLIAGEGALRVGHGPVRTGVTAILPRGRAGLEPMFAGWFPLNGNGEMTGTTWIEESGWLEGPVLLTNTHSVGIVRDAVIAWQLQTGHSASLSHYGDLFWSLPVVAETYDGYLNDINGFHVKPEHVFAALDGARGGVVAEGNVGGGTGMVGYGFKGGSGTASRVVAIEDQPYTAGVLVQCNCGQRSQLLIAGVPVGRELTSPASRDMSTTAAPLERPETGSILIIIATDAPLLPHQLKRLARRAALGLARTGSVAANSSGDIFLAFSTANGVALDAPLAPVLMLNNSLSTALFEATVQATEEAIINALVAAEPMSGIDNRYIPALPHEQLQRVLQKYGRWVEPARSDEGSAMRDEK